MTANLTIGLQLTLYGMGLVFLVLSALWGLITLLARLDRGVEPVPPAALPIAAPLPSPAAEAGLSPELLAAISVAVLTHSAIRRGQAAPAMRSHPPGSLPSRWLAVGRGQQVESWQPRKH